jgi:hypothetical protein
LQWSLTGPSGTVIDNLAFNAGDPVLKLASGTYTLTIDGVGDATPSYGFNLLDTAAAAEALTPGTPDSDSLNPGHSLKVYQFSASTGNKFLFDRVSWAGRPVPTARTEPGSVRQRHV